MAGYKPDVAGGNATRLIGKGWIGKVLAERLASVIYAASGWKWTPFSWEEHADVAADAQQVALGHAVDTLARQAVHRA
jgi:hypothetical protein